MEKSTVQVILPLYLACRASHRSYATQLWTSGMKHSPKRTAMGSCRQLRDTSNSHIPTQSTRPMASSTAINPIRKIRRLSSQEVGRIQASANRVLEHPRIPSEAETLHTLEEIEAAARQLVAVRAEQPRKESSKYDTSPASALLSLDSQIESQRTPITTYKPAEDTVDFLSNIVFEVVKCERVFITPSILSRYVNIQTTLQRPSTLPEVFDMYSHKPTPVHPKSGSTKITFAKSTPNAVAAAVSPKLGTRALATAIKVRDLETALSIISTTFGTTAFQRNKIFRQVLPPLALACLAPVAVWTLASNLSSLQSALPPETYTSYAFAAITTYMSAVGTIGYVALTTRNDQMERVTWMVGMPLWERWVREEERAACEIVIKAWGFRQRGRWGEEEGEEWQGLKEWLGIRGMVLDKVGLMEGME